MTMMTVNVWMLMVNGIRHHHDVKHDPAAFCRASAGRFVGR
jgi:hypothetical protein